MKEKIFGKPFTMEAFAYGLNMGLTFLVMLEWFLAFGCVMTADKFTFLFAPFFRGWYLGRCDDFGIFLAISEVAENWVEAFGCRLCALCFGFPAR